MKRKLGAAEKFKLNKKIVHEEKDEREKYTIKFDQGEGKRASKVLYLGLLTSGEMGAVAVLVGAGPILGPILMAVTIAAGLAQVATISSQEMPKFAMGGSPSMAFMYRPQGLIKGPGSGTSDSILARISNKEFIVNAEATARYRLLLENINIGRFNSGGFAGGLSYSSSHTSNIDTGATEELRGLRNEMKELTRGLNNALDEIANIKAAPAAIGDRACEQIMYKGRGRWGKGRL